MSIERYGAQSYSMKMQTFLPSDFQTQIYYDTALLPCFDLSLHNLT